MAAERGSLFYLRPHSKVGSTFKNIWGTQFGLDRLKKEQWQQKRRWSLVDVEVVGRPGRGVGGRISLLGGRGDRSKAITAPASLSSIPSSFCSSHGLNPREVRGSWASWYSSWVPLSTRTQSWWRWMEGPCRPCKCPAMFLMITQLQDQVGLGFLS